MVLQVLKLSNWSIYEDWGSSHLRVISVCRRGGTPKAKATIDSILTLRYESMGIDWDLITH